MLKRVSLIVTVWAFTAISASAETCYAGAGGGTTHFGTWKGIGGGSVSMPQAESRSTLISWARTAMGNCRKSGIHYKRQVARNYPDDMDSGHHFFDEEIEVCVDYFQSGIDAYADKMCD